MTEFVEALGAVIQVAASWLRLLKAILTYNLPELTWLAAAAAACALGVICYRKREADSTRNSTAVLASAAVLVLGWLAWTQLLRIFPAAPVAVDPADGAFSGPAQTNAFLAKIALFTETRAQRWAHLVMIGLLGLLILLRKPLLRPRQSSLLYALAMIAFGILAVFSTWLILASPSAEQIQLRLTWLPLYLASFLGIFLGTLLVLMASHSRILKVPVQWMCAAICMAGLCCAVVPAFTSEPDLSHCSWDDIICFERHYHVVVGPGDRLANHFILFADVEPTYGLLLPTLAAYQLHVAPLNWGDYLRIIQALQAVSLLLFLWLFYWYGRRNWLYCVAPLALILPFYFYDQPGIVFPNQTAWRALGIPIALAAMVATRKSRPLPTALVSGAVAALCVFVNFEIGVVLTVGLITCLVFRERLLERRTMDDRRPAPFASGLALAACCAGGAAAFLLLYLLFFRCSLGYWPDLRGFPDLAAPTLRHFSSGLWTIPLVLQPLPLFIFAHACFVVLQACAGRGLWRFRTAFRTSVALMLCLWFCYYVRRPYAWNLWTHFTLYSFLLIDFVRFLDRQLAVRRRVNGLTIAGVVAWTVIIVPMFLFPAENLPGLQEALLKERPKPEGELVCGVHLPADAAPDIVAKADFIKDLKEHDPTAPVVYLSPHSFLIPKLSGVYPASGVVDLGAQSLTYAVYRKSLERLTSTSAVIYLDADAPSVEHWGFGGLFQKLRIDLQEQFTLRGQDHGWEVWRRKNP